MGQGCTLLHCCFPNSRTVSGISWTLSKILRVTDDPLILIRFYYGPKWQQQINSGVFALSKFCLTVSSFKAIKEFRDEYHFMLLSSVAHCMDKLRVLLVRELPSRAWRESSVSHQPEHPCPNPP